MHPRHCGLVLMYHRLFPDSSADELDRLVGISVGQFGAQMDLVTALARPVSLSEIVDQPSNKPGPVRVAVTFDDGYADIVKYALPILRDRNIPATVFLTTGFVDGSVTPWWESLAHLVRNTCASGRSRLARYQQLLRRCEHRPAAYIERALRSAFGAAPGCVYSEDNRFLTWEEVARAANNGLTFENHTHSHRYIPTLSEREALHEVSHANRLIEEHTASSSRLFAFPGGEIRDTALWFLRLLRRSGFVAAFSAGRKAGLFWRYCVPRWLHPGLMMLPRRGLLWSTSLQEFRSWCE